LPIFRELESVWFRTRRSAPPADQRQTAASGAAAGTASASVGAAGEYASVSANAGAREASGQATSGGAGTSPSGPVRAGGGSDGVYRSSATGPPGSGAARDDGWQDEWRTAADDGWRAASTAAEARPAEVTPAGLPKRRPMAQLVPVGVERAPTVPVTQRRSPEAVRGLLSAYHRGVQRGRGQATEEETGGSSGGSQSTQAGKEQQT